jgi:hypothetical protein
MKFSTVGALADGRITVTAWPENAIEGKALHLYLERHGSALAKDYTEQGIVIDMTNTFANSAPVSLVFGGPPVAAPPPITP